MTDARLPVCSVIVCTKDRPDALDRCLAAVGQQDYRPLDVIVVDNAGSDSATREIARRHGATYVFEPHRGLSRARNRGVSASTADVVAFIDDDAVPAPGWLATLAREFADPEVTAATGKIVLKAPNDDPALLAECRAYAERRGGARIVLDRRHPRWFVLCNFGGIGDGGNMAFRRSDFGRWMGFDVRLGRGALIDGGEDQHAFFSLVARGGRMVYTPLAVVEHPTPATTRELRERRRRDLSNAAAYVALLCVEHWEYWPTIAAHLGRWLVRRPVRGTAAVPLVSSREAMRLRWSGLLLYLRSRLSTAREPEVRYRPAVQGSELPGR
jgi:cellulose synthase/poly-beta-1,6-N-acetylglucosamine synthase-like glycosyltransferase